MCRRVRTAGLSPLSSEGDFQDRLAYGDLGLGRASQLLISDSSKTVVISLPYAVTLYYTIPHVVVTAQPSNYSLCYFITVTVTVMSHKANI